MKTAGTSTEASMEQALWGAETSHHRGWRVYRDGFVTPRPGFGETRLSTTMSPAQVATIVASPGFSLRLKLRISRLGAHSGPLQISEALGPESWRQYKKFANVRNPYALMVSWHFFRAKNRGVDPKLVANRDSFQRFVEELFANSFWQEDLPDVVDSSWRLLRQECLVSDIRNGLSQLGLAVRDVPSYKSGSFPRGEAGYREFYSKSTRQLVEARYRKWLSAFNYEF